MHVINYDIDVCMDGGYACLILANLKYLEICVIDALKDKRWCSGLQKKDNTNLREVES